MAHAFSNTAAGSRDLWGECKVFRAPALLFISWQIFTYNMTKDVLRSLRGMPSYCVVATQDTAAAAIFLASKVEEFRVHIKDVMLVTHRVRHKNERRLVENSDVSLDTGLFVEVVFLASFSQLDSA